MSIETQLKNKLLIKYLKRKLNISHLIIQQFLLEANVHGVERSSSAWSLVFVRVHVKEQRLFFFLFYPLALFSLLFRLLDGRSWPLAAEGGLSTPASRGSWLFKRRGQEEGALI